MNSDHSLFKEVKYYVSKLSCLAACIAYHLFELNQCGSQMLQKITSKINYNDRKLIQIIVRSSDTKYVHPLKCNIILSESIIEYNECHLCDRFSCVTELLPSGCCT